VIRRIALLGILAMMACDSRDFFSDEGVWLGYRIGEAAERLRSSPDTMATLEYVPAKGTDQRYSVGIGVSRWCPAPPCDSREMSGLTVSVERGHHGSTTVHKRYVAVPAPLHIDKSGARTLVVLRKHGDTIQVSELR
jgi:hypothetical protein